MSTGVELIAVILAPLLAVFTACCKNRFVLQFGKKDGRIAVVMTLSMGNMISVLVLNCASVVPIVTDT